VRNAAWVKLWPHRDPDVATTTTTNDLTNLDQESEMKGDMQIVARARPGTTTRGILEDSKFSFKFAQLAQELGP